jgi:hypothetical protein
MNKALVSSIMHDIKNSSLRRLETAELFLQPFSSGYTPVVFSADHFAPVTPQITDKKMIFIDGGNADIVKTPDYSLHFVRFAAAGFVGRKRVIQKQKQGYVLVRSQEINGKMYFVTQCYSEGARYSNKEKRLHYPAEAIQMFDKKSPQLYAGLVGSLELCIDVHDVVDRNETPIAVVANIYRQLNEIKFAEEILEEDSVVVFDRALKPENSWEQDALASLYQKAINKNAIICGLNKTTSLLCNTGENVVAALSAFDRKGCWLYTPVFSLFPDDHSAALSFVKLHADSRYIFRFEIGNHWKKTMAHVISGLAFLSNDAVFLGYPYGLIVADQCARVSNREKEYLETMFFYYAGEKAFALEALNAHAVLDRLLYT